MWDSAFLTGGADSAGLWVTLSSKGTRPQSSSLRGILRVEERALAAHRGWVEAQGQWMWPCWATVGHTPFLADILYVSEQWGLFSCL